MNTTVSVYDKLYNLSKHWVVNNDGGRESITLII